MSIKIIIVNVVAAFYCAGLSALSEQDQKALIEYLANEEISYCLQQDGAHFIFENLDIKVPKTLYVWQKYSIFQIDLTTRPMLNTAPSMANSLRAFGHGKNSIVPTQESLCAFAKQLKIIFTCDIDMSLDVRTLIGEIYRQKSIKEKYVLLMAHSIRTKNTQMIKEHFEEISSAFGRQKDLIKTVFDQLITGQQSIN